LGEELERTIADKSNVYYQSNTITLKDWTTRMDIEGNEKDFFSDGVHLSKLTYQTWAKDFSSFIDEKGII
jgi:lysophospholipase L1-like esterase